MGCYNSTIVNAPVDTVWAKLRDFHDGSWAPNVIENLEVVGDRKGDQVGAQRILNGVFHETLQTQDEIDHVIRYSIDDGPGPVAKDQVSGYVGQIRLFPVTDGDATFVEWTSTWKTSNGGVPDFCNPIYQALLNELKAHFA